jgi:vesicle-associated membrane protein 4
MKIDDAIGVVRENIDKISQRGESLDSLQNKADNLAISSRGLRRKANGLRKRMRWQAIRTRMWLIIAVVILLIVIIVLYWWLKRLSD